MPKICQTVKDTKSREYLLISSQDVKKHFTTQHFYLVCQ